MGMTALPKDVVADLERENARLQAELRAARDHQAGSAEILRAIASAPGDAERSLQQIVEITARLFGASGVSLRIARGDEWSRTIRVGASEERIVSAVSAAQQRIGARNLPGTVLLENRQIHVPDLDNVDPAIADWPGIPPARAAGTRAMAGTPLRREGKAIGVLIVHRDRPVPFTADELALQQSFADQAVIAIENARLFNETRGALERQTATAEILKVIASSPSDIQPVFDAIATRANTLIGGFSSTVFRFIDEIAYLKAFTPTTPDADEILKATFPRPAADFPAFQMAQAGEVTQVTDTEALSDGILNISRARGFRSMLFAPLMNDGVSIGFIAVTRVEPGAFADHHVQLLRTFADQAVIAIENARLFEEVQAKTRDLTEALDQQTATAEVLKVISRSAFDLETVMNTLTRSASELCGAGLSSLHLREGDFLVAKGIADSHGTMTDFLRQNPIRIDDQSYSGRAVLSGSVANIADAQDNATSTTLQKFQKIGGYKAILLVPLMREGRGIGLFSLTRDRVGAFSQREVELVQTFADQAVIAIENVRLFDEVQAKTRELSEALTYQTGSSNILSVIASSPTDVGPVLKAIVESACELCDAYDAIVYLKDGGDLHPSAHHGPIPISEKLPIDRNWAAGRAFLDRKPVHVHDFLSAEGNDFPVGQDRARRLGFRSVLCVPLSREGESIGTIVLRRGEVHPFSDRQIALLQTFADQAVIAIGNVHLFEEVQARTEDLRESLEFQTATSDVLKVISSSPDSLQPVLDVIVDTARHLCGTETSTIFLLRDEKFHIAAASGARPEYMEFLQNNPIALDQAGSSTSRAAREKRTVHIPDIGADPEFGQGPMAVGQRRALLSVPLMRESTAIGVITMRQSHLTPFTERQIEVVQTFADQAVIAISNVRLFEEVQARTEDLRESLQQQTATADVLKVISRSAFDLQAVFDTLLTSAIELSGASSGTICVRDGDVFPYRATVGATADFAQFLAEHPATPGRHSTAGRVILSGEVMCIPDVLEDREFKMPVALDDNRTRAHLGVPLLRNDKVEGALVLVRSEPGLFDARLIELVKTFADQAVIAIENVRLFDEVQARTRELSQSLDDLRTAQDRLVQTEKLASLGQLTAGIAHEIKNPLNFVNNFAALSAELTDELNEVLAPAALDGKTREEVFEITHTLKDNLAKVVQHGKRADSIVKNMLLHSREGSGEHRPSDINALLDESLNLAYHGARAEKREFNVTLQRDFDATAGTVEVFPQEITRVFLNLIANGFYAVTKRKTENGSLGFDPVVSATTKNLGDTVEIRIRDNGTGIPAEVKEKMFNPFFTTKPAGEGTGLGLSMSHDIIVKQHGGTIDVETEPGKFTEFRIVLPRTSNLSNNTRGQT
jgi:GAF domain-containing protein